jgi:hypothetical protein
VASWSPPLGEVPVQVASDVVKQKSSHAVYPFEPAVGEDRDTFVAAGVCDGEVALARVDSRGLVGDEIILPVDEFKTDHEGKNTYHGARICGRDAGDDCTPDIEEGATTTYRVDSMSIAKLRACVHIVLVDEGKTHVLDG